MRCNTSLEVKFEKSSVRMFFVESLDARSSRASCCSSAFPY